jgi:cell division protein FtsI (penicillin-binding protein 3)
VAAIRTRDRDVKTTIDARLQLRVAAALRDGIVSGRFARGAAVVLDATSGELLAAASYPWPDERDLARGASARARQRRRRRAARPRTVRLVSARVHVQTGYCRRGAADA